MTSAFIRRTVLLLSLFLIAITASRAQCDAAKAAPAPDAAARDFYQYHFAHDMGFTPETVKARAAWLTPGLVKLCDAYFAKPQNPDEVPDIDGDPFTGSQEYPDRYTLAAPTVAKDTARVPITFSWKDGHSTKGTVVLKQVDGKWLIDDVEFPDQDSLRTLLASQD